jgi:hypothetical protein
MSTTSIRTVGGGKELRELWTSRVDVVPNEGNDIFGSDPGAFSNVLALAEGQDEFRSLVTVFFAELGLEVRTFDEIYPVRAASSVPPALVTLADGVTEAAPVSYDTFYVYESEDE